MTEIISFRVVKEPYGWAVRMRQGMMTPFHSRSMALRHANSFAEALRRHGEPAEVILEEVRSIDPPSQPSGRSRFRPLWS